MTREMLLFYYAWWHLDTRGHSGAFITIAKKVSFPILQSYVKPSRGAVYDNLKFYNCWLVDLDRDLVLINFCYYICKKCCFYVKESDDAPLELSKSIFKFSHISK